jgi:predicted metalloprotease
MFRTVTAALSTTCAALVLVGCQTTIGGRALSPLYDPFEVGGLPATDGPSGIRDDGPQPTGTVHGTDNGEDDRLALLAINDVAQFWEQHYSESLHGTFTPVEDLCPTTPQSRAASGSAVTEPTSWPTLFTARPRT